MLHPNLSLKVACAIGGFSKSWYYIEIKRPESEIPRPIKIGRRSFIRADEFAAYLASRPRAGVAMINTRVDAAQQPAGETSNTRRMPASKGNIKKFIAEATDVTKGEG